MTGLYMCVGLFTGGIICAKASIKIIEEHTEKVLMLKRDIQRIKENQDLIQKDIESLKSDIAAIKSKDNKMINIIKKHISSEFMAMSFRERPVMLIKKEEGEE
ncbi:hypothetical protein [Clostridium botulinum]|uniref:hypothetical protein n=1 Tax=Clostridium botulinum TaxID=1491 RepID=UPI001E44485E|nr:hypothetical protein [Clostridium botulinum]MCD3223810.1 hypothetical protein [Clostridium botulinum C/D]MCD3295290.1 hypothetical protein [Clostridium botulinum C/D]